VMPTDFQANCYVLGIPNSGYRNFIHFAVLHISTIDIGNTY